MGSNCTKETSNQDLLNSNHVQFKLMQSMHNEPFDGTYDQVDQIGTGSTCHVMKVKLLRWRQRKVPKEDKDSTLIHDCDTSRHFAIKEISGVTAEMITEFENEIKLLKAIDHPRIIKIFQTFRLRENRISAILMEMCQGGDLFSRQPFTEVESSIIMEQVLSAAAYLHDRNIVHRDLKHENILFVDNDHLDVKVIDFGLAKKFQKKTDRHYEKCGTMYTMSPEALNGNYTGSSTDLWSIGVIAYMLLSDQKPFSGKDMNEVKKEILKKDPTFAEDVWKSTSDEAQHFVSSLLQKAPAKRPTAKEALTQQFIEKHHRRDILLKANPELRMKIHDSMVQFISCSLFKKIIFQMIASRYPAKEILDLTQIFTDMDTTRRGTLSFSEFKLLLLEYRYTDTKLRSMFDCIALNRTGHILYTEFLACTLDAKGPIDQRRFREVFEQIDRSNKGYITKEDLRRILPRSITDKYLQNLLKGATVNGNVGLSFEVFLVAINQ